MNGVWSAANANRDLIDRRARLDNAAAAAAAAAAAQQPIRGHIVLDAGPVSGPGNLQHKDSWPLEGRVSWGGGGSALTAPVARPGGGGGEDGRPAPAAICARVTSDDRACGPRSGCRTPGSATPTLACSGPPAVQQGLVAHGDPPARASAAASLAQQQATAARAAAAKAPAPAALAAGS